MQAGNLLEVELATRVFCDHCGHEISDKNAINVMFGEWSSLYAQNMAMGGQNLAQGAQIIPPERVELCKLCFPIWMDRVRNLTKASDVSTK